MYCAQFVKCLPEFLHVTNYMVVEKMTFLVNQFSLETRCVTSAQRMFEHVGYLHFIWTRATRILLRINVSKVHAVSCFLITQYQCV